MNARIDRVVLRSAPRRPATAVLRRHGRCSAVTDLDAMGADVEVHEGERGAALQIAGNESGWILLAARPLCVVETVDTALLLSAGDVFMLPPGIAALLHGGLMGEWLAVRLPAARALRLSYTENLILARQAIDLAEALRAADTAFTVAQRGRLATRLLREVEHARRQPQRVAAQSAEQLLALQHLLSSTQPLSAAPAVSPP